MANNVNLKLTNYGLRRLMSIGAEQSFKYFSLSDMNEIYYVETDPNLNDIMNITGSKALFTARKSCVDAVPTTAQVSPPTETTIDRTQQRWLVNYYKSNCGTQDYTKSNLNVTINLHEYFNWLEGVSSTTAYTESLETSLKIIQGVYLNKQEQNFVDKSWSNIDTTSRFVALYDFVTNKDKENYLKFNSKYIQYKGEQRTQVDRSFDRFYTSLLLGFGVNIEGSYYLEGHNSYVTFNPPQFGYVVNGKTNFVGLETVTNTDNYKEITPAVIIGSNPTDLYYLNEPNNFRTLDINGFMGQAIWGYVNSKGQSLIKGMIEKAKNHVEFYFEETSFDKWELPINLRLRIPETGGLDVIGGNISYNFVYDTNATLLGYDNILIIN